MANLIVPTTENNEPMNQAIKKVAEDGIGGSSTLSEELLNQVETVIRAYDPCLSCSTHAIGLMPLVIEVYDMNNQLIKNIRSCLL